MALCDTIAIVLSDVIQGRATSTSVLDQDSQGPPPWLFTLLTNLNPLHHIRSYGILETSYYATVVLE
jgi:hypothetical protein